MPFRTRPAVTALLALTAVGLAVRAQEPKKGPPVTTVVGPADPDAPPPGYRVELTNATDARATLHLEGPTVSFRAAAADAGEPFAKPAAGKANRLPAGDYVYTVRGATGGPKGRVVLGYGRFEVKGPCRLEFSPGTDKLKVVPINE